MQAVSLVFTCLMFAFSAYAAPTVPQTRGEVEREVQVLWESNSFKQLDELQDLLLQRQPLTLSGFSLLDMFNQALASQTNLRTTDDKAWNTLLGKAASWTKGNPKSSSAHVTTAWVYVSRGWAARGGGFSSTVSPAEWREFRSYVTQAEKYLTKYQDIISTNPASFELRIKISMWNSKSELEIVPLINAALYKFPTDFGIYSAAVEYYSPKWGGSSRRIEEFAKEATSKLQVPEQDLMYARIYGYAFQHHFTNIAQSDVDCQRWLRGSEQIAIRFPTQYSINEVSLAAWKCSDKLIAKRYFRLLEGDKYLYLWGGSRAEATEEYSRARTWAGQ